MGGRIEGVGRGWRGGGGWDAEYFWRAGEGIKLWVFLVLCSVGGRGIFSEVVVRRLCEEFARPTVDG